MAREKDDVQQHSGWLIPLAVAVALLLLSGLFLGWYLRPGPRLGRGTLTDQSTPMAVTVQGVPFTVPANYIERPTTRGGGEQNALALAALFPSFHGYSGKDARLFAGNAPDSSVIHLLLRSNPNNLDADARLSRIYRPYILNPDGAPAPFALTQYRFAPESGYAQSDLFVGQSPTGPVLLLCERASAELPSPNCIAIDRQLARNLSFSYRFKRAYLARWREMAMGVEGLIGRFAKKN